MKKFIIYLLLLTLFIGGLIGFYAYKSIHQYINPKEKENSIVICIPTGSTYADVNAILTTNGLIKNRSYFDLIVQHSNYERSVKPGRYRVSNKASMFLLDELLRYYGTIHILETGRQEPVELTFNNVNTKADLALKLSKKLELSENEILKALNSSSFASHYGLTTETILTMFIPNTYEMYWTITQEEFFDKMAKEYKKFWNPERKTKAKKTGLNQEDVTILASIVEKESNRIDEKPIIAGVYLNRLRINMLLQADPTVKFAVGDNSIRRITSEHLAVDSPYNTYKHKGLPPGPICVPSISSLDAVLNYKSHEYIFFCAKGDGSGSHNFTKSWNEHTENAKNYRKIF